MHVQPHKQTCTHRHTSLYIHKHAYVLHPAQRILWNSEFPLFLSNCCSSRKRRIQGCEYLHSYFIPVWEVYNTVFASLACTVHSLIKAPFHFRVLFCFDECRLSGRCTSLCPFSQASTLDCSPSCSASHLSILWGVGEEETSCGRISGHHLKQTIIVYLRVCLWCWSPDTWYLFTEYPEVSLQWLLVFKVIEHDREGL